MKDLWFIIMWERITKFIDRHSGSSDQELELGEDELHLAAATLLVRAMLVDGDVDPAEKDKLAALLQKRYELTRTQTDDLIERAKKEEHEAVDLYSFTSVLSRKLDGEGRRKIIEMLWEIAYADGVLHEFEDNMVWRVAELLHVPSRDRLHLKKLVQARFTST